MRKKKDKIYMVRLKTGLPYIRRKLPDGTVIAAGKWEEIPWGMWKALKEREQQKERRGGVRELEFKEMKAK